MKNNIPYLIIAILFLLIPLAAAINSDDIFLYPDDTHDMSEQVEESSVNVQSDDVDQPTNEEKIQEFLDMKEALQEADDTDVPPLIDGASIAVDRTEPFLHNPTVPKQEFMETKGYYSTSLFTGAATYSYAFDVPPGIGGLQPTVALSYNSHNSRNIPSLVSSAWDLTQNYIQRDVQHTVEDVVDDTFKLYLDGEEYDLVYDGSRYHTEVESYLFITNSSGGAEGEYWIVKTKDGTVFRFGYNDDAVLRSNLHDYIWRWSLDAITDVHDNSVSYSYHENYEGDFGSVYPQEITYNHERMRNIVFIYETRPDVFETYVQGNKQRYSHRLKEVRITFNDEQVRKYVLEYASITQTRAYLSKIYRYNQDSSQFFTTSFDYFPLEKGWTRNDTWISPVDFEVDDYDTGVRFVDLNRDGLLDIMQAKKESSGGMKSVWLNNGNGWTSQPGLSPWQSPVYFVHERDNSKGVDKGARFSDLNNDGFTDLVVADHDQSDPVKKTYFNMGNGWQEYVAWTPPLYFVEESRDKGVTFYGTENGVRFVDLDNDGRGDMLRSENEEANIKEVWMNTEGSWVREESRWDPPNYFATKGDVEIQGYDFEIEGTDSGLRLDDVNGDGLPDLLYSREESSRTQVYLNDGMNWQQDASYEIPTYFVYDDDSREGADYGTRLMDIDGDGLVDIARAVDGVSTVWINNGKGWTQDNSWTIPLDFVSDKKNRGVRITDVNGDGFIDMVKTNDGRVTYLHRGTKDFLLKQITNELGGTITLDYKKSVSFDNTGDDSISDLGFNLWVVDSITEDNGLTDQHQLSRVTKIDYQDGKYNYAAQEFLGFNYAEEEFATGELVKHWYYQDDARKGKEYRQEVWQDNKKYDVVESEWSRTITAPYTVQLANVTRQNFDGQATAKSVKEEYMYDTYGNPYRTNYYGDLSIVGDEKEEVYLYVYNPSAWIVDTPRSYELKDNIGGRTIQQRAYSYDNKGYGLAPTKGDLTKKEEWLAFGQNPITTYSYDTYGNKVTETNPNDYTTTVGFDEITHTFPVLTRNALGQEFRLGYDAATGNLLYEDDPNGYRKTSTYDSFGRKIKAISPYDNETYPTQTIAYNVTTRPITIMLKQREVSNEQGTYDSYTFLDGFGRVIQTKKEGEQGYITLDFFYDTKGRITKISNPYYSPTTEYTTPQTVASVTYTYDAVDRITRLTNPDTSTRRIQYNHWNIKSFDENNVSMEYDLNAYGNVKRVTEYLNDTIFLTTYGYDASNNLVNITDDMNNVYLFYYDSLNRLTVINDPDLGRWNFSYDPSGNQIGIRDARSINKTIEYDELNRIKKEYSSPQEIIIYTYDQDTLGTLSNLETSEMSITYEYDQRLRLITERKVLGSNTFTTHYTYDAMDRITSISLPNGQDVVYNYNTQGELDRISDVITNINYNEVNTPLVIAHANAMNTTYRYYPNNFRLQRIQTGTDQNLSYGYDKAGNVIARNDTSNNLFHTYRYDTLYRLSAVGGNYTLRYSYDPLGNLLGISFGIEDTQSVNTKDVIFAYPQLVTREDMPIHAPLGVFIESIGECDQSQTRLCKNQNGVCRGSREPCEEYQWQGCSPQDYGHDYQEEEALCDGLDNDCDTAVDEGCECIDGNVRACLKQRGVCSNSVETCVAGKWEGCDYGASYETVEVTCDRLDNDCDTTVDEGCQCMNAQVRNCPLQLGVCKGSKETCTAYQWHGCNAGNYGSRYQKQESLCDGLDNDCDGSIDEGCTKSVDLKGIELVTRPVQPREGQEYALIVRFTNQNTDNITVPFMVTLGANWLGDKEPRSCSFRGLSAGQQKECMIHFSSARIGNYAFNWTLDSSNDIRETNETNNVLSGNFDVSAVGIPDLQALRLFTTPEQVVEHKPFNLSFDFSNDGTGLVGDVFEVKLSLNGTSHRCTFDHLQKRESATCTFENISLHAGTYLTDAFADNLNFIDEIDERNNQLQTSITVKSDFKTAIVPAAINQPPVIENVFAEFDPVYDDVSNNLYATIIDDDLDKVWVSIKPPGGTFEDYRVFFNEGDLWKAPLNEVNYAIRTGSAPVQYLFKAVDQQENYAESVIYDFTVEDGSPSVIQNYPPNGKTFKNRSVDLFCSFSDPSFNLKQLQFYSNRSGWNVEQDYYCGMNETPYDSFRDEEGGPFFPGSALFFAGRVNEITYDSMFLVREINTNNLFTGFEAHTAMNSTVPNLSIDMYVCYTTANGLSDRQSFEETCTSVPYKIVTDFPLHTWGTFTKEWKTIPFDRPIPLIGGVNYIFYIQTNPGANGTYTILTSQSEGHLMNQALNQQWLNAWGYTSQFRLLSDSCQNLTINTTLSNLDNGRYTWNCHATDHEEDNGEMPNEAWGQNRTFVVDAGHEVNLTQD
ncbi:VCBS repeat-containing protein [Candidatus Woesearchaeota archaeon]|nr:VCBS repeat-containing protein [Candidatus Woesearchaeota archaeon]